MHILTRTGKVVLIFVLLKIHMHKPHNTYYAADIKKLFDSALLGHPTLGNFTPIYSCRL